MNYRGKTYPAQPKIQSVNKDWRFNKFNIYDKYTKDVK